jgi:hypothetical protein
VGGLNSLGQVAGNYYFYGDTGNITEYGFIRDADGTITTFDLPFTPPAGTDLLFTVDGINDRGQVVGKFFASQAIPEPTSAILLGFGAVIVLAYRTGGRRLAISTLSRTLGRRDCHLT